jgi:hypothetical protein
MREQQAAKDPPRNVENTAHDVITPRQNNLFFYVSCNYDNCINEGDSQRWSCW